MANRDFFDDQEDQSRVKLNIVTKYFSVWSKIMLTNVRASKIAYVDLFAGTGRYRSGEDSTPIVILKMAIADPALRKSLITFFNDGDRQIADELQDHINNLADINRLHYPPQVFSETVGDVFVELFDQPMIPTFSFIDPWGYKGLSLPLMQRLLKDWGSECLFFFNYNRVNAALNNPMVSEHIEALFGRERALQLREKVNIARPAEREAQILEELTQAMKDIGGKYVLPFRFRSETGRRTTHYLIFVSKHFRGYDIMKQTMAKESSLAGSFEYSPATERQPFLFSFQRSSDGLGEDLLVTFAGQELDLGQIYEQHSVDTPFLEKDYRKALIELKEADKISVRRPSGKIIRSNTFPEDVIAIFPPRAVE